MPMDSADPFGGVILTDWYDPAATEGERFKLNIYILDRQLRADGIRVAVFRQVRGEDGEWADAPVAPRQINTGNGNCPPYWWLQKNTIDAYLPFCSYWLSLLMLKLEFTKNKLSFHAFI